MKLIKNGLFKFCKIRLLHDNKREWYYCQYSIGGLIWLCDTYDYGIAIFTHIGDKTLESLKTNLWVSDIYKEDNIPVIERNSTNWLTRFF